MSIIGIGVDIIKIARMELILSRNYSNRFIARVLHDEEIKLINQLHNKQSQARFLSSRWAVKEACVKALSNKNLYFPGILITKTLNGKPQIRLSGQVNQKIQKQLKIREILVSISHQDQYTIANVLIIKQ